MTAPILDADTSVRKLVLGVLTAVLAALLIPAMFGLVEPKTAKADFDRHVLEEKAANEQMFKELQSVIESNARIEDRVRAIYCEGRNAACR